MSQLTEPSMAQVRESDGRGLRGGDGVLPLVRAARPTSPAQLVARVEYFNRQELLRLLDGFRYAADEGMCRFILVSGTFGVPAGDAFRTAVVPLVDGRTHPGEFLGALDRQRLGVVLLSAANGNESETRADWYADALQSAGAREVEIYGYPLAPVDDRSGSRRADELPRFAEGGIEQFFVVPTPRSKRLFDMAAAAIGLVVLAPLFAIVSVLIKATSPGPILFCQRRTGKGGRPFTMYKFRSMIEQAEGMQDDLRVHNEQDGPAFKIARDPRVTPIGQLLRKTCIDELPQLWNVLRGEMSLVGPRPLPCRESAACAGWQRRRLNVLPGMTCLWQMRGRSPISFDQWMRMDGEYVRRQSFWLDLIILAGTVPALIPRRSQIVAPIGTGPEDAEDRPGVVHLPTGTAG